MTQTFAPSFLALSRRERHSLRTAIFRNQTGTRRVRKAAVNQRIRWHGLQLDCRGDFFESVVSRLPRNQE